MWNQLPLPGEKIKREKKKTVSFYPTRHNGLKVCELLLLVQSCSRAVLIRTQSTRCSTFALDSGGLREISWRYICQVTHANRQTHCWNFFPYVGFECLCPCYGCGDCKAQKTFMRNFMGKKERKEERRTSFAFKLPFSPLDEKWLFSEMQFSLSSRGKIWFVARVRLACFEKEKYFQNTRL